MPLNIYIIKPGEDTNRGQGILVVDDLYAIKQILSTKEIHKNGNPKTYIVYNLKFKNIIKFILSI